MTTFERLLLVTTFATRATPQHLEAVPTLVSAAFGASMPSLTRAQVILMTLHGAQVGTSAFQLASEIEEAIRRPTEAWQPCVPWLDLPVGEARL